jgi:PAS domain S-box-containing protein
VGKQLPGFETVSPEDLRSRVSATEWRRPSPLWVALLGSRSAAEASRSIAVEVARGLGPAFAFAVFIDPADGRLRGSCVARDDVESPATWEIDPVADSSALSAALASTAVTDARGLSGLPPPAERAVTALIVPVRAPADAIAEADCPRFECPARHAGGDVCGAGSLPDGAWTRDRLLCGRLPVLGLIGIAERDASQALGVAGDVLLALAPSVAPLFRGFRLRHALREGERFRRALVDGLDEGIIATNLRGDVLALNRAAERITGVAAAQAVGWPIEGCFRELGCPISSARETLQRGKPCRSVERQLERPDGRIVPIGVSTTLLPDASARPCGVMIAFQDLSSIKRMEQEIRRLDRLATLGRFAAAIVHEVRNPLAGIAAGIDFLAARLDRESESREHLRVVRDEVRRLDAIVTGLSSATHARPPDRRDGRVVEVFDRVRAALQPHAAARAIRLAFAGEQIRAFIDVEQVAQVLINLVKNAIDASPDGSCVDVRAERRSSPAGDRLHLSVADGGAGIPLAEQARIFEPFYTTKPGGTGLGLYVSHGIVERNGGRIHVDSETGRGTTMTIELPAGGPNEAERR